MPAETDREVRSSLPRSWAPRKPHLFVMLVGDRPLAGGMRCSLREVDEVFVGRDDEKAVQRDARTGLLTVALPDRKVSARHARLVRGHRGWSVEDLGSTNGTFVNGVQVSDRLLSDGDVVRLGHTVLRFRDALVTPGGTPEFECPGRATREWSGLATLVPAHRAELQLVERVARSRVPVLLLGETGTGKEVVANAIHTASARSGEFVAVNCAALPEPLVEALLFGHMKGAFSGASREEVGFVRSAHEGTLFLDEIGDLPRAAQAVLLRVLQEGEVVAVGSTRPTAVDLRVVAATHQPVEAMAQCGDFRRDLLARLQGFTHRLWRLADRREDLGLLVSELLPRLATGGAEDVRMTGDAAYALACYDWPLNVRELAQALARALSLTEDGAIELSHLPPTVTAAGRSARTPADVPGALTSAQCALRDEIVAHLERSRGNVSAVARSMNKAPMQIYRWMRSLHIDPRVFR